MTKPVNLLYGVDDKPPLTTTLILGLQHIFILFIAVIFPVIIVRQLGASISDHDARAFVSLSLLGGGIITILQSLRFKGIGSGYLCPALCGPAYLNASLLAASLGGLPLLFGMTAFNGFIEALFSRVMHRLRALFPPEVTGTVVSLVGIVVIPLSVRSLVGIGFNDKIIETREVLTGILTLAIMVGLNVYSKGKLKLYCSIVGMILGYLLSFAFGLINKESLKQVSEASFFSIPWIENMRWKFDFGLMIPFAIAALSSTLKTIGDLATCQKINDANWKRADMKSISGGILVDGLGGVIPGLIGGFGQSTSSASVGLSVATGATSRVIGYSAGALLILLAFFPKLANIFLIMPAPVMGAALIFTICFMVLQGLQMIMSRMLDARKIFVVGISLTLGLSVDMVPEVYKGIHPYLQPIFSSSLSLGAVSALVLNLLLRIGIKKQAHLTLSPEEPGSEKIFTFMEKQGQLWGARKEVIVKGSSAVNEAFEVILGEKLTQGPVNVNVRFNELSLIIIMEYAGHGFEISSARPDLDELGSHPGHASRLAVYLLTSYCTHIKISESEGHVKIRLQFEH